MAKSSARYCSSRTAKRLPNCVSFTSSQKHAASGSGAVLSANALASPGEPAIAKLRCGRTTCWSPPAASIRRPGLVWYRRSSTTASGKISSANIGNWRCQRGRRETPLTATLRAIERYPRSHLDLRSGRAQCDCNSTFARPRVEIACPLSKTAPKIASLVDKRAAIRDRFSRGQSAQGFVRPRVVIDGGDLIQPVDDLFVRHRGRVATSPFRFLAEERGIG